MRKAQITLFIILGLVLLLSTIVLVATLSGRSRAPDQVLPPTVRGVLNALHSCEEGIIDTAIDLQAKQGGWLAPRETIGIAPLAIGLAIHNSMILLPDREAMEEDLTSGISSLASTCADDVSAEAQQAGITVHDSPANATATIEDEAVTLTIEHPVEISWSGGSIRDNTRSITIHKRVGLLRNAAETIALQALIDPSSIDTDFLFDLPFEARIIGAYGGTAIISLTDRESVNPATFNIALPLPDAQPLPPMQWTRLENPILITAGVRYRGSIAATSAASGPIMYSADLPWLHVDPTSGSMTADVDETYKGKHLATISATDNEGSSISETVEVVVR